MDDVAVCVLCKKQETDSNNIVTCMYCFSTSHFKCKNIIGAAINRVKSNMFFCTTNCSEIYKRIVEMQYGRSSMISSLAAELKSSVSNAVADQMVNVKSEVRSITAAIEKSQDFLSAKFDDIVSEFKTLKAENENLKRKISELTKSHSELTNFVHQLESNVDKSDRKTVSNNAILLGLPYRANENAFNLVNKTLTQVGLNLQPDSIVSATRLYLSNKPNVVIPIKVAFKNSDIKAEVLSRKKDLGTVLSTNIDQSFLINGKPTNVTLRDELTSLSLELLRKMREKQESLRIKYVWPGRGGDILVKKDETSKPDLIRTREDLNRLIAHYSVSWKQTSSSKRVENYQEK